MNATVVGRMNILEALQRGLIPSTGPTSTQDTQSHILFFSSVLFSAGTV